MDPISVAILMAAANLSHGAVRGAYTALKAKLRDKFAGNTGLMDAVDKLEEKPDSKGRLAVVRKEVESSGVNQDPELLRLANVLLEELKKLPGTNTDINQDIKIRGNRNIITGQGDVTVNE